MLKRLVLALCAELLPYDSSIGPRSRLDHTQPRLYQTTWTCNQIYHTDCTPLFVLFLQSNELYHWPANDATAFGILHALVRLTTISFVEEIQHERDGFEERDIQN